MALPPAQPPLQPGAVPPASAAQPAPKKSLPGSARTRPLKTNIIYRSPPPVDPADASPARSKKPAPPWKSALAALGVLGALLAAGATGFVAGRMAGGAAPVEAAAPAEPQVVPLTEAGLDELDGAMTLLREGEKEKALLALQKLREAYPHAPSLDYAIALAALEAGDPVLATRMAESSAKRRERVADSLALAAVALSLRAGNSGEVMGDPGIRAREMLEQAIAADPLNPGPRMELAGRLRAAGYTQLAGRHLRAARALVLPVDSAMAIEVALALMDAQQHNPAYDPAAAPGSTKEILVSAYLAARSGDVPRATSLLSEAKQRLPSDTLSYILSDPAFRSVSGTPGLQDLLNP